MATFYYPNRTTPTTTLVISPLSSFPNVKTFEKIQTKIVTPGGTPIVYDLGLSAALYLTVSVPLIESANRTALQNFIITTVDFATASFDFTDDLSVQYDDCLFWFDTIAFSQIKPEIHQVNFDIRVGSY